MALTSALPAYRLLKGVFAVYKPTSTPISALLNEISSRILVGKLQFNNILIEFAQYFTIYNNTFFHQEKM